jgi:predicted nucleotidyltransferase
VRACGSLRKLLVQLKTAYGARLRQVVLFGTWVRGEAHEESDVELIVVLDHIENRARERARLVEVLYDLEVDAPGDRGVSGW